MALGCCGGGGEVDESGIPTHKSACYKLKQQELRSFTPIFQPKKVVVLYYLLSFFFIPIGAVIYATDRNLYISDELRYDNIPACSLPPVPTPSANDPNPVRPDVICTVDFTVNQDTVEGPVYLYYGLDNFFQNARNYVKSRSDAMNRGVWPLTVDSTEVADCQEEVRVDSDGNLIVPCGLTADSVFNDTLTITRCIGDEMECTERVEMRKEGIAWESDLRDKFNPGPSPAEDPTSPWTAELANATVENEDFVVWMRLAAFKRFTKLYRILDNGLERGRYQMTIEARYNVEPFEGEKFFVLAQAGWLGVRNNFLGIAYLATGGVLLFLATLFLARHLSAPRRPAFTDPAIVREHIAALTREQ